jgi:hypothetical protein
LLITFLGKSQKRPAFDRREFDILDSDKSGATMSIYDDLENGISRFIEELKSMVGQDNYIFHEALGYQSQLHENISYTRQFGETNDVRSRRNQILYELNRLSLKHLGKDFNSFYLNAANTVSKNNAADTSSEKVPSKPISQIVEKAKRKPRKKRGKIFISHSSKDKDFVVRLSNDLKNAGYQIWYSGWEIKVGDSIVKRINEGLAESSHLAVILSPNSVTSKWVQQELNSVLMEQLSKQNIIILPILYQQCEIPLLLRDILYADMSTSYEIGLEQLLQALTDGM